MASEPGKENEPAEPEPVELEINGVLDLHSFRPWEVRTLVIDYLEECRRRGILDVRIIHGKGTGVLRETVNGVLDRGGCVESYRLAGEDGGGWGATLVRLRPSTSSARDPDGKDLVEDR